LDSNYLEGLAGDIWVVFLEPFDIAKETGVMVLANSI
jgi:hypothetical protein